MCDNADGIVLDHDVQPGNPADAPRFLQDGLPTAVIAANDPCAIGVLDVFARDGRSVPGDVSVIGYDDARFNRIPGVDLTSVRQSIPKMAKLAVEQSLDRLERPDRKPVNRVLRPKLAVRATTGPPPRHE